MKVVLLALLAAQATSTPTRASMDMREVLQSLGQHGLGERIVTYETESTGYARAIAPHFQSAEDLLQLLLFDPILSLGKNAYCLSDVSGSSGTATRSAAVLSGNCMHKILRGLRDDAARGIAVAAQAFAVATTIMAGAGSTDQPVGLGYAEDYVAQLLFLVDVLSMYLVFSRSKKRETLCEALDYIARCAYAKFNSLTRANRHGESREVLCSFLQANGTAIGKRVSTMFRGACPGNRRTGDEEACFLAIAHYGVFHDSLADEVRPRLCATAFCASRSDICTRRRLRFLDIPVQSWHLLVYALHCGFDLPMETSALAKARIQAHGVVSSSLYFNLFNTDDPYAVWYGNSFVYARLTPELYRRFVVHLRPPHYSLNLKDARVHKLILEAVLAGQAEGDHWILDSFFKGPDAFYLAKTWADAVPAAAEADATSDDGVSPAAG